MYLQIVKRVKMK